MKTSIWAAAAAAVSLPGEPFANAQQRVEEIITECPEEGKSECAAAANRTCYNYEESDTRECGYCLDGFFEYDDECVDIDEVGTDGFLLLSRLLVLFLPEYVNTTISTQERAARLEVAARIISFWNSKVPPPPFRLGLSREMFLTEDERRGRLGILADVEYDGGYYAGVEGNRGDMGRLDYLFVGGEESAAEGDAIGNVESVEGGTGRRLTGKSPRAGRRRLQDLPAAVDWDEAGYTTVVKNQGLCGCCWAVSTAGAVEAALMITGQTPRYDSLGENSLSFQQMISCDKRDLGCNGGNILQATRYVWEHNDFNNNNFGGLFAYNDWPYSDFFGRTTEECPAQEMTNAGKTPAAYLNFPKIVNSVNDRSSFGERKERLMAAVATQPVISVLRSGCDLLVNYQDGVLTSDEGCQCCETKCIDHAIVIVGYNASAPTPYWKLRNSWGSEWGEEGHFRITMNEQGCGWGLFGMLAESAIPSEAYKNLEDLPERPSWWERAPTWQKVLTILASVLGFCFLCGCLARFVKRRRE